MASTGIRELGLGCLRWGFEVGMLQEMPSNPLVVFFSPEVAAGALQPLGKALLLPVPQYPCE